MDDVEDDFVYEVNDDYSTNDYFDEYANVGYEVPLFDGHAQIVARTRFPAKKFDVWAEVSAVCSEGALVSAAGTRDHVWLGFVQNKAVLRWDAGSGPFELHTGKVKIDGKQKISAKRYKKDAMLKLGSATASGTARGRMTSLDVDSLIYVGHPPGNVTRLAGASKIPGFVGCVHKLRVSGRDLIPPAKGLTFTSQGVRACTPHNLAQLVCP